MSTPLYFWSALNRKREQEMEKARHPFLDSKFEVVKRKGKRVGKSANPPRKKEPQRGMGVAQLERLRLEEGWKKLTETGETQVQNAMYPFPFSFSEQPQIAAPVSRPTPIRYTLFNGSARTADCPTAAYGARSMLSEHVSMDQLGAAALEARFEHRNIVSAAESTIELTSIPKTHCFSVSCEVCSKKKRPYADDIAFQGNSRRSVEYNMGGCRFTDRNLGSRRAADGEIVDFGETRERRGRYFGAHVHAGGGQQTLNETDAAFQKKSSLVGECRAMKYDFVSGSSAGQEATEGDASSSPPSASSFLDLNLKLSSY